MGRELDDAILMLRTNELDIGTWLLKTAGDAGRVLAADETLAKFADDWFVRETTGLLRRALARLDVSSRTLIALIDAGSCFAGTLFELALAADRSYMLDLPDDPEAAPRIALSTLNFGAYPSVDGLSRLESRFYREAEPIAMARAVVGQKLAAHDAAKLGLVTAALDDIDWADEIRIVLEPMRLPPRVEPEIQHRADAVAHGCFAPVVTARRPAMVEAALNHRQVTLVPE